MTRITEKDFNKLLRLPNLALPEHRPPRVKVKYKTPESPVKAACMAWLAQHQVFAWRNNTGAYKTLDGRWIRFGYKGSSDILGITKRSGRLLAVECKSSTGEQDDDQITFMMNVRRSGGVYIVARSVEDLEKHKHVILG